ILYTGGTPNYNSNDVVVPDFSGLNEKAAQDLLNSVGLKGKFSGSGLVCDQDIKAGSKVQKGTTVIMDLDNDGD
ncbi:MAG: PASTA domain-containing protein, partial [Clostridium sp.]|nr:PASTA domain-containing protein [Clostridium sp.]